MKKTIIRKSKINKVWLGATIANGRKKGVIRFKDENRKTVLQLFLTPYSGFQPCDDKFQPYFQCPILLKGLSVLKPKDCSIVSYFYYENDNNVFINKI